MSRSTEERSAGGAKAARDPSKGGRKPGSFRLRTSIEGVERSFLLFRDATVVGSHPRCDIVLPVVGVSRRHARFEARDVAVRVYDLESRNGTTVEGESVGAEGAPVEPGDTVRVGPLRLVLEAVSEEDGRLAFRLPDAGSGEEPSPVERPDPSELTEPAPTESATAAAEARGYRALARAAEALYRADSLHEVAAGFGRELGAGGLHVGVTKPGATPRVLTTWGTVGEEGEVSRVRERFESEMDRGRASFSCFDDDFEIPLTICGMRREGWMFGVVVRGDFSLRIHSSGLLDGFLRLVSAIFLSEQEDFEQTPAHDSRLDELRTPHGIVVSRSPEMQRVYGILSSAARSDARILLLGETGVGKEHLARAVHDTSERREQPWVALNCAAIPTELLEAELFGIERGVATGVDKRSGAFHQADGGTIFLDEVAELAPELQAKLLRVLEEEEVRPVGGSPHGVDVRVISATNVEIERRIEDNRFRADLYYRLAGTVVRVPALRERREDIPPLTEHFLRRHAEEAARAGHRVSGLSVGALERLTYRAWPGNIRELEAEIRRLVWACESGQIIDSSLLDPDPGVTQTVPTVPEAAEDLTLEAHVKKLERRIIAEALRRTEGSQRQAAKVLGIARNTLAKKIRELEIPTD